MAVSKTASNLKYGPAKILIPMGKRWYVYGHTTVDADGNKSPIFPIRKKIHNWRSRTHIYTSMIAEDGSELIYGIPLDLDFENADKRWVSRGKLDYKAIKAFLDETYPVLGRYLCTYTRSTRGKGLGLILFVDPFLRDHEKTGAVNRLAEQVQRLLVVVLNYHGLGCDSSARGINRFTPNWRNKRILLHKDDVTIRRVQRESEPHQVLRNVYNELRRSQAFKLPTRKDELVSGKRFAVKDEADLGLAKVYAHILYSEPESLQITTSFEELSRISALSIPTLRKYFSDAKWIKVSSSYATGLKVKLLPSEDLSERALGDVNRTATPRCVHSSSTDWDLPEPEDVWDGDRNNFIWRKAVLLRNEGYSIDEAISLIRGLVLRIPGARDSRNCRKLEGIVTSIFRHDRRDRKAKRKIFPLEALTKSQSYPPHPAQDAEPSEEEIQQEGSLADVPGPDALDEKNNTPFKKGGQGEPPPASQSGASSQTFDDGKKFETWLLSIVPKAAAKILNLETPCEPTPALKVETERSGFAAPPAARQTFRSKIVRRLSLKEARKAECRNVHPLDRLEKAFVRCGKPEHQILAVLRREHQVISRLKKAGRRYSAPEGAFKRVCEAFSYVPEKLRAELLLDFES